MTASDRRAFAKLDRESPVTAAVRTHRGAPRLFVNGVERYPFFAWSWELKKALPLFRKAGIDLIHPILGLNDIWPERGRIEPERIDTLFARFLKLHPDAYFLPRIHLDVPAWWKTEHPEELVRCALPLTPPNERQYRAVRKNEEGGMLWGISMEEPSFASLRWQDDMERILRALLRHVEDSPLASRMLGYQIGAGIYGEWHAWLSEFMPDVSEPMQARLGPPPTLEARLGQSDWLLRDPAAEGDAIAWYRRFHEEVAAGSLLHFARVVKDETGGRALCGAFYAYLLENVWIQEGGHLAPRKVFDSPDIDFLASPYSYQTTNVPGRPWWEHDIIDGSGNALGRTRGVAGDGGYRVLLESVKRAGKLYFVELDAATWLEPDPETLPPEEVVDVVAELRNIGGAGSTTREGTAKILERDFGRMLVSGCAGWIFDFGPVLYTGESWYADPALFEIVRKFADIGAERSRRNLASVAEVAAVYDAQSFFATRHWRAEFPFPHGGENVDFFSRWFMSSQVRALHRLGAPIDFLYRDDLVRSDMHRYKLLFMANLFFLGDDQLAALQAVLEGSGVTVVWCYAPAFVHPQRFAPDRMEALTGFSFELIEEPGVMMIRSQLHGKVIEFGVAEERAPRFRVVDAGASSLGEWSDGAGIAFAEKSYRGFHSIYLGTAPAPVEIWRELARRAGAALWSSECDQVVACEDLAMLVATTAGARTLDLPKQMRAQGEAAPARTHRLDMELGEVRLFQAPQIGG